MKGFLEAWAGRSFAQKTAIIAASLAVGLPVAASIDLSMFDRLYVMAGSGFLGSGLARAITAMKDKGW